MRVLFLKILILKIICIISKKLRKKVKGILEVRRKKKVEKSFD